MGMKSLLLTGVLVLGAAACSDKASTQQLPPVASAAGAFEPYLNVKAIKQGDIKGESPPKPKPQPTTVAK
jgi:hypothetical protein